MDDPPLHTLCPTCHLHPPLYTCPRCTLRSCSLACVQIHKRRSGCSGVRDPTVYKPMRELATPAGVDHDFNFLSGIERGVERSDRFIVEGGLIQGGEVRGGPGFGQERRGGGRGGGGMGELERKVGREIGARGVRWERLPAGMGRRKANGTGWSKKKSCLVWQVEWVAGSPNISTIAAPTVPGMLGPLGKILATTPLGEGYAAFVEEERRKAMSPEERAGEKKRRAGEVAEREGKRVRISPGADGTSTMVVEGQAQTDTDTATTPQDQQTPTTTSPVPAPPPQQKTDYAFYLHRPLTLASGPTVLIPLRADEGLDTQLGGKVVLEFPRVYVFPAGASVGEGFSVEGGEQEGKEEESEEEEEVVSDTSSSGSSSEDESSEEESEDEGSTGVEGKSAEEATDADGTDAKAGVAGVDDTVAS